MMYDGGRGGREERGRKIVKEMFLDPKGRLRLCRAVMRDERRRTCEWQGRDGL